VKLAKSAYFLANPGSVRRVKDGASFPGTGESHLFLPLSSAMASVADPLCSSRIRIFHPGSGSVTKNLSIFKPKNCSYALGKMIWDVHPGSGSSF
jgi:hypothetical protein